jgi:hypothetical protein
METLDGIRARLVRSRQGASVVGAGAEAVRDLTARPPGAGFDVHVAKPVDPARLVEVVAGVAGRP